MSELTTVKPKLPLDWAAAKLVELSAQIENADDLSNALLAEFSAGQASLTESIERRKALKAYNKSRINELKSEIDQRKDRIKFYERINERLHENTKAVIEQHPEIPFIDSLGKRVQVVKNGQPKLNIASKLINLVTKSVSNVIDAVHAEFFGIPKKYIKPVTYLTLDTELLKADLLAGEKFDWAELEFGTQLRGL